MAFLRKAFGIGKIPADLRKTVAAKGVQYEAECLPVTLRFTGQVPGRRSVGLVRSYGGALVLTNERVLALLSALPRQSGRAVDHLWTARQPGMVAGTFSEAGLLLEIPDLSVVDPEFSGSFSLTFTSEIASDVLARLPTRSIGFDVPPKFVYRALGVPH